MAQQYTDQQVAQALAALEANGGNVKRTALEMGVPRATLQVWRDRVLTTVGTLGTKTGAPPVTVLAQEPHDFAAMWGDVQRIATQRLRELLPVSEDLKAVAVAAGIAADKHLDYTQGRKGSSVNIAGEKVQVVFDV